MFIVQSIQYCRLYGLNTCKVIKCIQFVNDVTVRLLIISFTKWEKWFPKFFSLCDNVQSSLDGTKDWCLYLTVTKQQWLDSCQQHCFSNFHYWILIVLGDICTQSDRVATVNSYFSHISSKMSQFLLKIVSPHNHLQWFPD